MAERTIEELAAEVVAEDGINLSGFTIDAVDGTPEALVISFSWRLPTRISICISMHEYDSVETIKHKIRSQLAQATA